MIIFETVEIIVRLKTEAWPNTAFAEVAKSTSIDGGASLINLKRSGSLKSDTLARDYIEKCLSKIRKRVEN